MNENIKTAVRMIGHLLEHHPTTGESSRDVNGNGCTHLNFKGPASWCLVGADNAIADSLKFSDNDRKDLWESLKNILNSCLVQAWEGPGTSDETRLALARKLQEIK